jgi:ACS family tartrate transporter-like MFS transporter
MSAIPLASIIGSPLSGIILGMGGITGLSGWQWLFIIEGIPASVLGLAVFAVLPEDPGHAGWLTDDQKQRIATRIIAEDVAKHRDVWPALRDPRLMVLALVNLSLLFAGTGTTLWLPQIMQAMGYSNLQVGFLVALPYAVSLPAMFIWGRSSDINDERVWHVAIPALLAAASFVAAWLVPSGILTILAITTAAVGLMAMQPPYFGLLSTYLSETAVAGGTALVLSISNLGSFLGPSIVGVLKEQTGGYAESMALFGAVMMLAAFIILLVGRAISPLPKAQPAPAA